MPGTPGEAGEGLSFIEIRVNDINLHIMYGVCMSGTLLLPI